MNIPKVNISFRKLKADVVSSSEEDGLLTFHYTICPDASAEDSFPERFQLSSSSLPYIRLRMTFPALGIIGTWMADSGFSKNLPFFPCNMEKAMVKSKSVKWYFCARFALIT